VARPARFEGVEVLDRATELFWRDGCDAVTIRDLEVALDLRAPSIYRRFTTKHHLIACCVDHYVDRVVRGRVHRMLEASDDPIEGLRSFFLSVLEPFGDERGPRGCLLTVTAGQAAFDDPEIGASVRSGFEVLEAAFRVQLERAQATGQLRDGIDVGALATGLLAAFEGLLVLARSNAAGLHAGIDATLVALLSPT